MYIHIDEAGDFSWKPTKISLIAALITLTADQSSIHKRFSQWKDSVANGGKAELKGAALTDDGLAQFVSEVFPDSDKHSKVLIVGADTSVTSEDVVLAVRDQAAEQFARAKEMVEQTNPANKHLIQAYSEMPGWIRHRSSANVFWICILEEIFRQSLQLSILAYADAGFDEEFANIEFEIDRSFIQRVRHEDFWKEWLRNAFQTRSHSLGGIKRPRQWSTRNHPFLAKYRRNGIFDFSDLSQNHLNFKNSEQNVGIQLADICAHIVFRHLNQRGGDDAFAMLMPRILQQDGADVRMIHMTANDSLWSDSVSNHVRARA